MGKGTSIKRDESICSRAQSEVFSVENEDVDLSTVVTLADIENGRVSEGFG